MNSLLASETHCLPLKGSVRRINSVYKLSWIYLIMATSLSDRPIWPHAERQR
jgi:hypothetical protein